MKSICRATFHALIAASIFTACKPGDEPINRFSDPVIVRIADYQDRRNADSLLPFFHHSNSGYRRAAVMAFGSLQDPAAIERIGKLLVMDADDAVRRAAAFAIGQTPHPAGERILLGALVKEKVPATLAEILNAYGKTTARWRLEAAAFEGDSVVSAGLAWSLYRAGLRGKTDSVGNSVAMRLLTSSSRQTRLGAAHYFARGASEFENSQSALIAAARDDRDPEVRMASSLALAKIPSDPAMAALKDIIRDDKDTRVVVNAIRALRAYPFASIRNYLYEALGHKDLNVAVAASEVIVETITSAEWIEVASLTSRIDRWRVLANLYLAGLKAGSNDDLAKEVVGRFEQSQDPFERSALLNALQHHPPSREVVAAGIRASHPAVRSGAAAALVAMNRSPHFAARHKEAFAKSYGEILETSDDPAVLGIIASALGDSTLSYRGVFRQLNALMAARGKLKLPDHNEALQSVDAAIAYLKEERAPVVKNEFNHPVDWELVKSIPSGQLATIRTSRGNITIRLAVDQAPGSVANFITLAKNNYFDDKFIHRVVPNFVIQAGCDRGDGWGGLDYSIRSEFSPSSFGTGSVGMASAGKDTEGTQWFITHSPTPHLDGRYTLFAEVVEGMQVVHYLAVGDKIMDVEIQNFTDQ